MRIILIILVVVLMGCQAEPSNEDMIKAYQFEIEDIWSCDTRKEPDCMKDIYHIGYRRNGTMYVWRVGDWVPSTICKQGECAR